MKIKRSQHPSYLMFILVLSLFAIIVLAIETFFKLDQATRQVLSYADYAVCAVFFIDFLMLFFEAGDKARYFFTWGWLDLLSSIPVIEAFRLSRLARVFRIFRVLRGIKSARLITKTILEKKVQSAVMAVVLVSIVLITISSISILHFESAQNGNIKTAEDAIWWSITTVTTVGYGDKFPLTTEGRAIAALLMIAGVGLFGTISGFVASSFVSSPAAKEDPQVQDLHAELEELKQMVREMKEKLG